MKRFSEYEFKEKQRVQRIKAVKLLIILSRESLGKPRRKKSPERQEDRRK